MKNLTFVPLLPFILSTLCASTSHAWNDANNPRNLDSKYNYLFDALPLAGETDTSKRGWGDTYWPYDHGMIVNRWQIQDSNFKKDKAPSTSKLAAMSLEEINLLSPAEKYDLANSDLNFTFSKSIRDDRTGREPEWRGICNGWSQASLYFDEPKPFIYENQKLGVKIPFGSSDMKALLSYYYAKVDDSEVRLVGKRCRLPGALAWSSGACADMNAGAFHVVMANELGIRHQGFTADRDMYNQVWNQPFVKFESKITSVENSKRANREVAKTVYITSQVTYADEIDPVYEAVLGTEKQKFTTVEYTYSLDLDSRGRIMDGSWTDGSDHPDFIWKQKFAKPESAWNMINVLYEQSQK